MLIILVGVTGDCTVREIVLVFWYRYSAAGADEPHALKTKMLVCYIVRIVLCANHVCNSGSISPHCRRLISPCCGTVLRVRCIPPFVVPDFVNAHYRSHKIDHGTSFLLAVSAAGSARKRYTGGAHTRTLSNPVTLLEKQKTRNGQTAIPRFYGRSDRVRTCGIEVPNFARYQLRHTPKCVYYSLFCG